MAVRDQLQAVMDDYEALEAQIVRVEDERNDLQDSVSVLNARIQDIQRELDLCQNPVKKVSTGIFTRSSLPTSVSGIGVATLPIFWSEVEKSPGSYDFLPLHGLLDKAAEMELRGVRLRPLLGVHAPLWAKSLGAGPIDYVDPQDDKAHLIPDIWDSDYQDAATRFLEKLAHETDLDPLVTLVYASGAMTVDAEPMIRGLSLDENRKTLQSKGYTIQKDLEAQRWQLDAMQAWIKTPIALSYNPLQQINEVGHHVNNLVEMTKLMDYHIGQFGLDRTVLCNNSIRSSYISSPPEMYDSFKARPLVPHQFQCEAKVKVGDEFTTIEWARTYLNASGIEVSHTLSNDVYEVLDKKLSS